jgi:hypothetical protein
MNRESKLNLKLPSAFSGKDRRKWKLFLAECAIHFQAKPKTYSDDVAKITFAASLLEDAALKHYTIMLQQQSDSKFFKEWPVFIANMGDMFGVPNQQHESQRILSHLKMSEDERFAAFITWFQENAFDCGYNEAALKSALRNSICERLLSRLQYQPELQTYGGFISLLLQIDSRYWDIYYDLGHRRRIPTQRFATNNRYPPRKYNFSANQNNWQVANRRPPNKEGAQALGTSHELYDEDDIPSYEDGFLADYEDDFDEGTSEVEESKTTDGNLSPMEVQLRLRRYDLKFGRDNYQQVPKAIREERMCKGLCLNCGKPGHFAASCNQKRNEQGRSSQDETTDWERAIHESPPTDETDKPKTQWGPYFPENHLNE